MIELAVVSVPVSDPDRAVAFYVGGLGFALTRDEPIPPGRWLRVRPPGGAIELSLVTWFDTMPAGSLRGLVLHVDDLPAEHSALVGRGVVFETPPETHPWGFEAILHDPDGNELVLQQR